MPSMFDDNGFMAGFYARICFQNIVAHLVETYLTVDL